MKQSLKISSVILYRIKRASFKGTTKERANDMAKVKKGARGQNEGTIRERFRTTKEGKKVSNGWEARYTSSCDADGKQIQKSIYGMSRKEVMEKQTDCQTENT